MCVASLPWCAGPSHLTLLIRALKAVIAGHGPWRPFLAPLLASERVTAAGHERDTRLLALGLRGSGLAYAPGDLAAILPAQVRTLSLATTCQQTCRKGLCTRVRPGVRAGRPGSHPASAGAHPLLCRDLSANLPRRTMHTQAVSELEAFCQQQVYGVTIMWLELRVGVVWCGLLRIFADWDFQRREGAALRNPAGEHGCLRYTTREFVCYCAWRECGRSGLCCRLQAPSALAALLARLGLSADDRVRVEVNGSAPGGAAAEVRPAGSASPPHSSCVSQLLAWHEVAV